MIRTKRSSIALLTVLLLSAVFSRTAAAQDSAPLRLTLRSAIERGLQANLSVLVAGTRVEELEGTRVRRLSAALLPRVRVQSAASLQNRNLRAFGISAPGLPEVVGPFSNYDFRAYAEQNILDLQGYRNLKSTEQTVAAGKLDYQDARDLVIRSISRLYLNAQSAQAHATAAQARVAASSALFDLAKNKHDAGTATGVDVLRAQVQLANDKQRLLIEQNQYKQALLALARNIGMRPGAPMELAEVLAFEPISAPEPNAALGPALQARSDYLSLAKQKSALEEQRRASSARYLPKVSVAGNYGGLGRSVGGVLGTGFAQAQIDLPIFDRDRNGEAQEIESRIKRVNDQIADLGRGIEQELHEAVLNLNSATEQVAVAKEGQELAQRELELAQDRFHSGVTNNVELVTAQDELARAQENYIVAVTSHVDAKFALARALGATEQNVGQYLGAQNK